jgi:drug/metabolite transporter (DMT)-like permease
MVSRRARKLHETTVEPYVALTLLSSLLFAGGNLLQKRGIPSWMGACSLRALIGRPLQLSRALLRSPLWLVGLLVTVCAVALETQALGLGDVSVVKPLSRVQTVFVVLAGVSLLGERVLRVEWLGLCVMTAGAVLLGLEPADDAICAPGVAASLATAVGIASVAVLLVVLGDREILPLPAEVSLGLAAGACFGLGDVMMKIATEVTRETSGPFDLTTAASLETLVTTPELVLSIAATTAAFGLQQVAFSRGRVSLAVPAIGVAGMVIAVLAGGLLLGEPLGAGRLVAIGIVVGGTTLLSVRDGPDPNPSLPPSP